MTKRFTALFVCISLCEIICGELNFIIGVYLLKPLIVSSLIYYIYNRGNLKENLFITALCFSLLGDIFLMLEVEGAFLFGLGSFLLTHVLFIFIFWKKAKFRTISILPLVVIVGLFYYLVLYANVPAEFRIPVILYMLIITLMGITLSSVPINSGTFLSPLSIGALLFIFSDSLIAVNKFVVDIPYPTLLIMSTYAAAQFLITKGYLQSFSKD